MKTIIVALALVCSCTIVHAAEIDFSAPVLSVDGKPFKDCGAFADDGKCTQIINMTLGKFAAGVLNSRGDDRNLSFQQIVERGTLARRLFNGGKQNVDASEIKLIEDMAAKSSYAPLLVVNAIMMIDPDALKKQK